MVIVLTELFNDSKFFHDLKLINIKSLYLFNEWFNSLVNEEVKFIATFLLWYLNAVEYLFMSIRVVADARVRLCAYEYIENTRKFFFKLVVGEIQFIVKCITFASAH